RAIVVLCGAAGSGKTTFVRRHFLPSQILSSDFCRQLVCDRVDWSPHVSPAAFRVLHTILEERLRHGLLTVVDSTAVLPVHRSHYIKLARRFRAPVVLIVMNIGDQVCIDRDRRRPQRVGERAIITQWELLQNGLERVDQEGFSAGYMLGERTPFHPEVIIGSGAPVQPPPAGRTVPARALSPNDALAASLGVNGRNGNGASAASSPHDHKVAGRKSPARKK